LANSDANKTLVLTCIIFLILGSATAAVGPVLPTLAGNTHPSLADIGSLFTAIFLGALISQFAAGPISDRIGQPRVLLAGIFLLSFGLFGFTLFRSLIFVLIFAFIAGLGHGAMDLGSNVLISRVFASRNVSALNILNLFFGLGAFIGPACVSLALSLGSTGLIVLWINAILILLAAPFVIRMKNLPLSHTDFANEENGRTVYRSTLVWLLGFMILIYVGTENGLGGWITTYVNRTTLLTLDKSALVSAGFWGALTLGRLVAAYLGTKLSSLRILLISLVCAILGGLAFALSSGSATPTILAILFTGFSFGAIYPTTIAIITTAYHNSPGKAASIAAAMGSLGGMLIPWLQGVILQYNGALATAWFVAFTITLMALVFAFSQKIARQPSSAVT
jgi:fucose permease